MVQVRCPDCGYLQSLSEERFLNISEDFLNCPHCHAKIPKTWKPVQVDSVPEEIRHKIMAFSSRILNGGEINREVVCALESLFRKYGPLENSVRALGVGYASVGEPKKAEEFLTQLHKEDPNDREILQALLKINLEQEKYDEAVDVGLNLYESSQANDDDIGRLGLALIRLGRHEEAHRLLDASPYRDVKNPSIKKARKELNGGSAIGLGAILGGKVPFNKIFSMSGKESLKALSNRARSLVSSQGNHLLDSFRGTKECKMDQEDPASGSLSLESSLWTGHCEYWVYSPTSDIPSWEELKRSFLQQLTNRRNRSRQLQNLENLIARQKLTIDYILRDEAEELFEYPVDLLNLNSRELDSTDLNTLENAQMIIRIRFTDLAELASENIIFLTKFVEAVRGVSGGVIQDAVSHVLWGNQAWQKSLYDDESRIAQSNTLVDLLDEGGLIWAHSHGMQKFGLPDVELEGVPKDLGPAAARFVLRLCETLIHLRARSSNINQPINVQDSPVLCAFEYRETDSEGHFPVGSLGIFPYLKGKRPETEDALFEVLRFFNRVSGPTHSQEKRATVPPRTDFAQKPILDPKLIELRQRILDAHRKARSSLDIFRQSFQNSDFDKTRVHAVKVGFPAYGGQYEWMWISLNAWRGQSLVGFLENAPVLRKDLHKGSKVRINEAEIFDWVIASGDNIVEGGYTEQVTRDN
ncbi:MAG: DUF2314 domain-containing protein [Desulfomonilaceae bacterium]